MAQLDVQPKKSNPWWIWLLVSIAIIALILFFAKGCNNSVDKATAASDGAKETTATGVTGSTSDWSGINFNSPAAAYDEITDSAISVRGGDGYAIYSLGENVLFDTDKSTIKPEAESNLKQLAASLDKRFKGGEIRIYGHTDAEGSAGYNKQLAEQRAEAVKTWLEKNGQISGGQITLHPVGESAPVASNATESGRQQNRRVEIVAKGNK